jgi:hypothetical protein
MFFYCGKYGYTFGDHIVRLLIGAVDHNLDKQDEKKTNDLNNGCCIII